MAKILYEVKQNKADKSKAYGKWFGYVKSLETMNTRKLAKHISEHGSVYTQDVVFGVLEKFRSCLVEMLLDSKKVRSMASARSTAPSRTRRVAPTRRRSST